MSKTLLVIPHYNDTARLSPFLCDLIHNLASHFSILVSDDGSSPEEQRKLDCLIKDLESQIPRGGPKLLQPIYANQNTGKGGAVYRGWDSSEDFSMLAFTDADGAVSSREIIRAESYFRSDERIADALFASRVKMLGRSIERSLLRHLTGRVFATIVSELGNIPAYDTQCGLKILRSDSYQKIRRDLQCLGFAFDVELALCLINAGSKIIEFPIDWHDVSGSKVNLLRDSIGMVREVIEIKSRII